MKAIYTPPSQLCVVIDTWGDFIELEPINGTPDERFTVPLGSPHLLLDPTDDEIDEMTA